METINPGRGSLQGYEYTEDDYKRAGEFVNKRKGVLDNAFQKMKPLWDEDYDLYKCKPERTTEDNKNDAKFTVPRTREIIETIQPRQAGDFLNVSRPYINVIARTPEFADSASTVQNWLFYRLHEMDFPTEFLPYSKQNLIYGSTVGILIPDDTTPWQAKKYADNNEWDKFFAVDLYNFRIDPQATSQNDAFDMAMYRSVVREVFEVDASEYGFRGVEEVRKTTAGEDKSARSEISKEKNEGAERDVKYLDWYGPWPDPRPDETDPNTGMVTKKRKGELIITLVKLANDICVYMKPDPFGNRRNPFIFDRFEEDPFEIFGTGIARMLRPQNEELTHIRRLRINLLHRLMSPMAFFREGALVNPEEGLRWRPWGKVKIRSGEPINNVMMLWTPGPIGAATAALLETESLEKDIQGRAAVPDYIRGFVTDAAAQTATAFTNLLAGANSKLAFNFKKMAETSLKYLAVLILEHDQQRLKPRFEQALMERGMTRGSNEEMMAIAKEITERIWVVDKTVGEGQAQYAEISYWDLLGEYEFFPNVDPQGVYKNMLQEKLVRSIPMLLQLEVLMSKNVAMGMDTKAMVVSPIAEAFVESLELPKGAVIKEIPPELLALMTLSAQGIPGESSIPPGESGQELPPSASSIVQHPIEEVKKKAMSKAREAGVEHV